MVEEHFFSVKTYYVHEHFWTRVRGIIEARNKLLVIILTN